VEESFLVYDKRWDDFCVR